MADSEKSWENATRSAVKQATKSGKNIRSVWAKDQNCNIKDDKVKSFRATVKVTFEVK